MDGGGRTRERARLRYGREIRGRSWGTEGGMRDKKGVMVSGCVSAEIEFESQSCNNMGWGWRGVRMRRVVARGGGWWEREGGVEVGRGVGTGRGGGGGRRGGRGGGGGMWRRVGGREGGGGRGGGGVGVGGEGGGGQE